MPAIVEFRPMSGLYRVRGHRDGTRVVLPTPMICFTSEQFDALAHAMFNGGPKQPLLQATLTKEHQAVQAEIESLTGVEERTAGIHHDLGASYDRVVGKYFGETMVRPRLVWSKVFSSRKFGHYDAVGDTVMISCTLDRADIPDFVIDFIMYHELLHKKLGAVWRNGRKAVHTPEFRREEKRFKEYAAAEAALTALAGAHG